MARPPSPAQRANQVTFLLKGHLKNAQIAFIRAAILLARVRDEKLWQLLRHPTIEDYAKQRLGLGRAALYHYLQIHDWLREFHPAWLAPKPKGFIPELSDTSALMWIEKQLRERQLSDADRNDLEAMRKKALAGALSETEFRELRARLTKTVPPLRAMLSRLRSARRAADRIIRFPAAARSAIDDAIRAIEQELGANRQTARLAAKRAIALSRRAPAGRAAAA